MIALKQVKEILVQTFPEAQLQVNDLTGTQDHYRVEMISSVFKDKSLIEQHQLVMEALANEMKTEQIHTLSIKTKISEE